MSKVHEKGLLAIADKTCKVSDVSLNVIKPHLKPLLVFQFSYF